MRSLYLIYLLAVSNWMTPADAYGRGAPESACRLLMPEHGSDPLTTPSPYVVTPVETSVEPGTPVTVRLESIETAKKFKGFLLQAIDADDPSETPIGTFVDKTRNSKLISCKSGTDNTLTHKDAWKKQSLTVTWTPPADFRGQILFRCTFVESFESYWIKVPAGQQVHVGHAAKQVTSAASDASCPFRPLDLFIYLMGYCLAAFA